MTNSNTSQLSSTSVSPTVDFENECRENEREHQEYLLNRKQEKEWEAAEEARRANERAFVAKQTAHMSLEEKLNWLDEYDINRKLRDNDEWFAHWDSPFYQTPMGNPYTSRLRQWWDRQSPTK